MMTVPMSNNPVILERPDLFASRVPRFAGGMVVSGPATGTVWTCVKGTWHGEWADPGSLFRTKVMDPPGFVVAARVDYWTGNAGGLPKWLSPWQSGSMSDWKIGGDFLAEVLDRLPFEQRNLLTHSHGLQVGACAAALVPVQRFVSICGPVRSDMRAVYAKARLNVRQWTQVSDATKDWTQWFGEWFDGSWSGRVGDLSAADRNVQLTGIGHSDLLYKEAQFPAWSSQQILK